MPKWIHDRAQHILAKNPEMPESQAWAIATQQAHALGKSPKDYGTAKGRKKAKNKFKTPEDDVSKANPGNLESSKIAAILEELEKIGAISDEQARRSLDRLETLEQNKPTLGQMGRYATIGAVSGPSIKMMTNAIKGRAIHDFGQAAGGGVKGVLRGVAGDMLGGAAVAGAVPLLRSHFDRKAEMGVLKKFVSQHQRQQDAEIETPTPVAPLQKEGARLSKLFPRATSAIRRQSWELDKQTLQAGLGNKDEIQEKLEKAGFQQSMYGSTGGFVDFHQVSAQAPARRPSLQKAYDQKVDSMYGVKAASEEEKEAGVMSPTGITPAARLSSAMRIGKPKVTNPSGPSIADIAKPRGFGTKIPGATKSF